MDLILAYFYLVYAPYISEGLIKNASNVTIC